MKNHFQLFALLYVGEIVIISNTQDTFFKLRKGFRDKVCRIKISIKIHVCMCLSVLARGCTYCLCNALKF